LSIQGKLEGAEFAIKVLDSADRSLRGLEEYRNEVELLAALRHPHVVQVFGKCDEVCALVMELMEGGTLQDRLDDDTLPWWGRVRVLHEAALGLQFLHNQESPIMHRDIKPSNLLLTRDMRAKLADVGLAKRISSGASSLTTDSVLRGTFHYLAPEYQEGGRYNAACDVYALGLTIAVTVTWQ
jgi:serine/threonine protein kinase